STSEDALRPARALASLKTAPPHAAPPRYLRHTVPGIGTRLRRVGLYAMHRIERFPSVHVCASYGRVVQGRKAAGGQRVRPAGQNMGQAHRQWAWAAAAPLLVRHTRQSQKRLARLEHNPDTGKTLRILAHTLGRTVYFLLKRQVACAREMCRHTSGSRAGEP